MDASRFQSVDVDGFVEANENVNTLKKTLANVRLLRDFMKIKNEEREIQDLPPAVLAPLLADFFVNVRTSDGEEYEPSTLRGMMGSFERYLRRHKYGYSVIGSTEFARARDALKAKQKDLKGKGKGNKPNRTDPLTPEDIDRLYEAQQLGKSTPTSVINSLWFNNTLYFGMRGGKEHHDMKWGDVVLQHDDNLNLDFLLYHERSTKTRSGVDIKNTRTCPPRMYENPSNPDRCPVSVYKFYAQQRPTNFCDPDHPFYLSVITHNKSPRLHEQWFLRGPMGIVKINELMKRMANNAHLPSEKNISNTSVRKTLVQRLTDCNVPDNLQVYVTGHKNPQSLNNYRTLNDNQKFSISHLLSNPRGKENSISSTLMPQIQQSLPVVPAPCTSHDAPLPPPCLPVQATRDHMLPLQPVDTSIRSAVTSRSSYKRTMDSIFAGTNIYGNVNVEIHNNYPSRKRIRVIESDSDTD